MSFAAVVSCNCVSECDEVAIVDGVHSDTEARVVLHRRGWDCDTLPGGRTVDVAPGHHLERAA